MKKEIGFGSSLGFVLAAAGSAVGLGNLWGFPYKTHEYGGAAFVLVYIFCVLFIGLITMLCEIHIGRRAKANPVTAYKKISTRIGWFGILAVIIPAFIACYYSVLGGYTVRFAVHSFSGNAGQFISFAGDFGTVIFYIAVFIALAILIVTAGVKSGIERAAKILMPALLLIMVATVIYSFSLGEGVREGIRFYMEPDFSQLTGTSILTAMGQAFYSLSLGMGAMVAYGSYTGREINVVRSTAMICLCDTVVALLAGFAIFPAIYHYQATTGMTVESFQGVGLMFQTLPLVFEGMGGFGKVVGTFFFAMVAIAAITSVISLLEVVCQFIIQKFHIRRRRAVVYLAALCFLIAVPVSISLGQTLNGAEGAITLFGQNLLDLFDIITNTVLMPVCALFSCVAVGWILGPRRARQEMTQSATPLKRLGPLFAIMVKYVTPLLILVIEIMGVTDLIFPKGASGTREFDVNGLGITLVAYALLGIGVAVYFLFLKNKDTGTNLDEAALEEEK